MSGTTSALIHLTELGTNTQFKLTADKIINFYSINGNTNSHIEYVDHDMGTLIERDVVETAPTISAAALTTFFVQLTSWQYIYINADRLVYAGDLTTYRQIYLARPIVPLSNKDLGALPGNIQEKIEPYILPLFDNLKFIQSQYKESDKEYIDYKIENLSLFLKEIRLLKNS